MPDRDETQEKFLDRFVERDGDLEAARKDVGISKSSLYGWLRSDEVFRSRFDSYRLTLAEGLENEAVRRAMNPEGQRGSDALVTTLLKGLKKERYGEKDAPSGVSIVYISGLRDIPRPGAKLGENDAHQIEPPGRGGGDQPGDGVPAPAGSDPIRDRDVAGGRGSDAPANESAGWRDVAGA